MSYQIHITAIAERDIIGAADYIEFNLKNPEAAEHLLDEASTQISSLSDFPERFNIVDDSILASWGIRFIIVNNYLAFYIIDEKRQLVTVVRFLFQKSNWKSILKQGFSSI
jgi:plasmid stabilization system protein ParE